MVIPTHTSARYAVVYNHDDAANRPPEVYAVHGWSDQRPYMWASLVFDYAGHTAYSAPGWVPNMAVVMMAPNLGEARTLCRAYTEGAGPHDQT